MATASASTEMQKTRAEHSANVVLIRGKMLKVARAFAEEALLKGHPRLKEWFDEHKDELGSPTRPVWVAKNSVGEIIGIVIGRLKKDIDGKCSIFYVADGYLESAGTKLLKELEYAASRSGLNKLHVHIFADEIEVIKLFRKSGYRIIFDGVFFPHELPEKERIFLTKTPLEEAVTLSAEELRKLARLSRVHCKNPKHELKHERANPMPQSSVRSTRF